MASQDALDHVRKPFGKKEKRAWAQNKEAEDLADENKVSLGSLQYREHIRRERERLGLSSEGYA